ncbi:MAG: hypothetical protein H6712_18370 [Myxococcales bacterium]|nr:hypothetical protein [Myxococcales bacterium]MCB9715838.1 hypothetical protein [Myxococcales bacterium]
MVEADGEPLSPARRLWIAALSGALLLAIVWPMLREPREDDFPLSTYPMFSYGRERARAEIVHVVGFSREGRHRPVPPELLGTEEVMQAHQTVRVAIRRGHADELCQRAAQRVRAEPGFEDLEQLEVRTDFYESIAYFDGDTKPRATRVHARCPVEEAGR